MPPVGRSWGRRSPASRSRRSGPPSPGRGRWCVPPGGGRSPWRWARPRRRCIGPGSRAARGSYQISSIEHAKNASGSTPAPSAHPSSSSINQGSRSRGEVTVAGGECELLIARASRRAGRRTRWPARPGCGRGPSRPAGVPPRGASPRRAGCRSSVVSWSDGSGADVPRAAAASAGSRPPSRPEPSPRDGACRDRSATPPPRSRRIPTPWPRRTACRPGPARAPARAG